MSATTVKTRAALAVAGAVASVAAVAPAASAASGIPTPPAGSYQLSSSTYNIGTTRHWTATGYCATGYHVFGHWVADGPPLGAKQTAPGLYSRPAKGRGHGQLGDEETWLGYVTVNGDWIKLSSTVGAGQTGTDSSGKPIYQGVTVTLYNQSWAHSHDGSFTWTCVPN